MHQGFPPLAPHGSTSPCEEMHRLHPALLAWSLLRRGITILSNTSAKLRNMKISHFLVFRRCHFVGKEWLMSTTANDCLGPTLKPGTRKQQQRRKRSVAGKGGRGIYNAAQPAGCTVCATTRQDRHPRTTALSYDHSISSIFYP